jgi:HEAT repeat protein
VLGAFSQTNYCAAQRFTHDHYPTQGEMNMGIFGPPNVEKMKERRDMEGLSKALRHKEVAIRRKAAIALGELDDRQCVEPLITALDDTDEAVRATAASNLTRVSLNAPADVQNIASAICTLTDKDEALRYKAVEALEEYKDPRALSGLFPLH